jgi:uncharacterized protein YbjT (DUF2867 family)
MLDWYAMRTSLSLETAIVNSRSSPQGLVMTDTQTILITGAGGTVGSAVAHELASRDIRARLAFHTASKAERARAAGADARTIDYQTPATLRTALEGIDSVFLLAAGLRGQYEAETAVLEEAKRAGVKNIVKVSAWDAQLEGYEIARMHRRIERAIEESGLSYTFLRANGFMQNLTRFSVQSIAQGTLFHPLADAKMSYVDARDIARVAVHALTQPAPGGRALDLSGPEALSYADVARVLSRVLERSIQYVPVDDATARAAMLQTGMPEFYADAMIDLHRYFRTGAGARVTATVAQITGRPPTGFERFVRDHLALFR